MFAHCARINCEREATTTHPIFSLPVCSRHTQGTKRRTFSEKRSQRPIFAGPQVQKCEDRPYQGSLVEVSARSSGRYKKPWRLQEREEPTVRLTPEELLARLRARR